MLLFYPTKLLGILYLFCLSFCSFQSSGQPFLKPSLKVVRLAKKITIQDTTHTGKAERLYFWIANNIAYDVKAFEKDLKRNQNPNAVLRRRKAVCEGYSNLYASLCAAINIPCDVVHGYGKGVNYCPGDRFYYENHAWNAVYYDSSWHLVDVTWGAGYVKREPPIWAKWLSKWMFIPYLYNRYIYISSPNPNCFDVKPEVFVVRHFPHHAMWQLRNYPVSYTAFETSYMPAIDSGPTLFSFEKEIAAYRSMGNGQRLLFKGDNIKRLNEFANLSKGEYYYLFNKSLSPAILTPNLTSLDTTEKYVKLFLNNNKLWHIHNKDTIYRRTTAHMAHFKRIQKITIHQAVQAKREFEAASNQMNNLLLQMKYLPDNNKRKMQIDINLARPRSARYLDKIQRTIEKWKGGVTRNRTRIDSLGKVFLTSMDSTQWYRMKQEQISNELYDLELQVSLEQVSLLQYHRELSSTQFIQNREEGYYHEKLHQAELLKTYQLYQKRVKALEQMAIRAERQIVNMSQQNLKTIVRIKKNSFYKQGEEQWFVEEKNKLNTFLELAYPILEKKLEDTEQKQIRMMGLYELFKSELKTTKREMAVVQKWSRELHQKEMKRYNAFDLKAKTILKETKSWQQINKKGSKRRFA